MAVPLSALECELLEAVLEDRENARAVLGDYWLAHVDEVRGAFLHMHVGETGERIDLADEERRLAELVQAWRTPLLAAGYREQDLVLVDGFLQWPLSIEAGHALDGDPDIVRLSPRYYRTLKVAAHGSEGIVLEAEAITPRTKTRVAIKAPTFDEYGVSREREILATLSHPNLPRVLGDAIVPPVDGDACRGIVLAWAGTSVQQLVLATRRHQQTLGVAFAISVGVQLLDALAALDRAVVVHREVRTDHVLVNSLGVVTLIDFGYAAAAGFPWPRSMISPVRRMKVRYCYLSPEQARGAVIDHRSDVFSAAGLISELVANVHPLPTATNDMETLRLVVQHDQLVSLDLPPALAQPLQRALLRERDLRPRAQELRDALVDGAKRIRLDIGPHVIAQRLVELGVPT